MVAYNLYLKQEVGIMFIQGEEKRWGRSSKKNEEKSNEEENRRTYQETQKDAQAELENLAGAHPLHTMVGLSINNIDCLALGSREGKEVSEAKFRMLRELVHRLG